MKKALFTLTLLLSIVGTSFAGEFNCTEYANLMVKVYQLGLFGEDCHKIAYKRQAKSRAEAFFQSLIYKACLDGQIDRDLGDEKDAETAHNYYYHDCMMIFGRD